MRRWANNHWDLTTLPQLVREHAQRGGLASRSHTLDEPRGLSLWVLASYVAGEPLHKRLDLRKAWCRHDCLRSQLRGPGLRVTEERLPADVEAYAIVVAPS